MMFSSLHTYTKFSFFIISGVLGVVLGGYGLLTISCAFLFLILFEKYLKIKIPVGIAAVFVIFIIFTLILGSKFGFYEKFLWWDTLLHTFYGGAFAFVGFLCIQYMSLVSGVSNNTFIICAFSFCFAVAGGALWEIYEFSYDYFTQVGNMQRACMDGTEITRYSCEVANQRGVNDTMSDIIVETSAAFFVNVYIFFYLKFGKNNWVARASQEFIGLNTKK